MCKSYMHVQYVCETEIHKCNSKFIVLYLGCGVKRGRKKESQNVAAVLYALIQLHPLISCCWYTLSVENKKKIK